MDAIIENSKTCFKSSSIVDASFSLLRRVIQRCKPSSSDELEKKKNQLEISLNLAEYEAHFCDTEIDSKYDEAVREKKQIDNEIAASKVEIAILNKLERLFYETRRENYRFVAGRGKVADWSDKEKKTMVYRLFVPTHIFVLY